MRVVLTTCRAWPEVSVSDRLLADELVRRGHQVVGEPWNDSPIERFAEADLVVLRSNWDYHGEPARFAAWLDEVDVATTLVNPAPLVRWNLDKGYLLELDRAGLPIAPTIIAERGDGGGVSEWAAGRGRLVLKPAIGASGTGVQFVEAEGVEQAVADWPEQERGQRIVVQEFIDGIAVGEWAVAFFAGRYSHTFLRLPSDDDYRVNGRFGGRVVAATPTKPILDLATAAVAAVPVPPTYARIDIVVASSGPVLMEVEVNEPALGLQHDDGAAARFADALVALRADRATMA